MRYHIPRGPLAVILLSVSAATLLTASIAQASQTQAGEPPGFDRGFCLTLPASQLDPGFGHAMPGLAAIDPSLYVEHPAICAPAPEAEPAEATPEPALVRLLAHS